MSVVGYFKQKNMFADIYIPSDKKSINGTNQFWPNFNITEHLFCCQKYNLSFWAKTKLKMILLYPYNYIPSAGNNTEGEGPVQLTSLY
jgi:hypothetical protein